VIFVENHMNQWELIEIHLIEPYVMVLRHTVIMQIHVKMHVDNINILHYKMEMVIKDGAHVIMILLV